MNDDHDSRIRELEKWRPSIEQRISDVLGAVRENTRLTKETNEAVKEMKPMADFYSAGRINAKMIAWTFAVLGGIGGVISGIVSWLHK